MNEKRRRGGRPVAVAVASAFAALAMLVAATTASARHAAAPTLVVWTDDVRAPGFKQYAKTHPSVKLDIKVIDQSGGKYVTKILLAKRAGGNGYPDVVFDGGPDDIAALIAPNVGFAQDITSLIPRSLTSKFAKGSLAQCTIGGKLFCLRNDLAQVVLWYDAKLMKQFGYAVPTTWQQWQAIGLKVAKDHPGYIVGSFGDFYQLDNYFWSFNCPVNQLLGADVVRINTAAPGCHRMTSILDPLLKAGSLSKEDSFGTAMTKLGKSDKILMLPAASWFGEYIFKDTFKTPSGELAAAAPLKWQGAAQATTGAQGGGIYFISAHTKYQKQAVDLITWMATNVGWQSTSVTYPAYAPAAAVWHTKTLAKDKFYASDPYPALKAAAGEIGTTWSWVRYPVHDPFNSGVLPAVHKGSTIASTLSDFGKQLSQLAQQEGYTVKK